MSKAAVGLAVLLGLFLMASGSLAQEEDGDRDAGMSFQSMDEDGDGEISWEEYSKKSDETDMEKMMREFQRLDKDSTGSISREQWIDGTAG
jgi:hypothetical protein